MINRENIKDKEFSVYEKKTRIHARQFVQGEELSIISIASGTDPKEGDMVILDPVTGEKRLVVKEVFEVGFTLAEEEAEKADPTDEGD